MGAVGVLLLVLLLELPGTPPTDMIIPPGQVCNGIIAGIIRLMEPPIVIVMINPSMGVSEEEFHCGASRQCC